MILVEMLLACGLGALIRYLFSGLNSKHSLPWGTLVVNLLGSFLLAYAYKHLTDKGLYLILATGFCGGLTTFSSLQAEFLTLWPQKKLLWTYLGLSYGLGLVMIFLGISL